MSDSENHFSPHKRKMSRDSVFLCGSHGDLIDHMLCDAPQFRIRSQSSQSQQVNLNLLTHSKMVHSFSANATLSSSVHSAMSSHSYLSAQLANGSRHQAQETFSVPAAKSLSIYISPEDEDKIRDSVDHDSEPPLSIHDDSRISQEQDTQEFPLSNCFIRLDSRRTSRISPLANSNLGPSPLTESSTKVMEREYNRDTWRMYERIQSARSSTSSRSGGGTLPDSKAERGHCLSTIESDGADDSSCSSYSELLFAVTEDHNESDTMFELDL
jgi:hypothetical protein